MKLLQNMKLLQIRKCEKQRCSFNGIYPYEISKY